ALDGVGVADPRAGTRPHVVEAGQAGEQQRGPQSEDAGGAEAVVAQDRSGCGVGARALDRRRRRRVGEFEQHHVAGGGVIGGDGGVPTEAPGVEGAEAADDRWAGGPGCRGQASGERGPVAEAEREGPRMGGTAMCGGGDQCGATTTPVHGTPGAPWNEVIWTAHGAGPEGAP